MIYRFLLGLLVAFFAESASADCIMPPGKEGQIQSFGGVLYFCDGAEWNGVGQPTYVNVGCTSGFFEYSGGNFRSCAYGGFFWSGYKLSTAGACSQVGAIRYHAATKTIQTCDGSVWYVTATVNGSKEYYSNGTFVVPAGVTSVSVLAIGAGGGGGYWCIDNSEGVSLAGRGGGGGALAYASNLAVTPGQSISVFVGLGGDGSDGVGNPAANGGDSSFGSFVSAGGGRGGGIREGEYCGYLGSSDDGEGGLIISGTGGAGASGNPGQYQNEGAGTPQAPGYGGGGGGAGGYSAAGNTGSGGSGKSGVSTDTSAPAMGGGGVGLLGAGPAGTGDGEGGSNGQSGYDYSDGEGAEFGGGGGGMPYCFDDGNPANCPYNQAGRGANGVVRILWGQGRSFPNDAYY